MKLTEDPEKQTLPGSKAAFRLLGADGEDPPGPGFSPRLPTVSALRSSHAHIRRVPPVGRAAVGGGASSPGGPGAETVASRGPGVLYREAGPCGAAAATLGPAGTGDGH